MQARRQDLAAGEAKNQKGEHILKILRWIYAATREPNVKWGDRFQMGAKHHWPPHWRWSCFHAEANSQKK